jgi:hypothetical protein
VAPRLSNTKAASRSWDSAVEWDSSWWSGAREAFGSWDPTATSTLGSAVGFRSWDPESPVEAPFKTWGCCGSSRSMTHTMLTASAVTVM